MYLPMTAVNTGLVQKRTDALVKDMYYIDIKKAKLLVIASIHRIIYVNRTFLGIGKSDSLRTNCIQNK
jgi:hypothetical protein